jgi:Fe-S oxidoreductase
VRTFAGRSSSDALAGPVFVHEPCAFRHGRDGTSVFDVLVRAGVSAVRFAAGGMLGGAAPACVDAPAESEAMGEVVRAALGERPPKTLVTSDPACLLQFRRMTSDLGVEVIHAATALRRVLAL